MPFITVLAVVVVTGYALFVRVVHKTPDTPQATVEATPEASASAEPVASNSPTPSTTTFEPRSSPISTSGTSKINIKVDTLADQTTPSKEIIIYPGAKEVGNKKYKTDANGDTVYDWYKNQLNSRSYQIRNNVKTKANEKFVAVLQGVSGSTSIKITIEKENNNSPTKITVE